MSRMSHTPGPWAWHREETAMQEFRGYSVVGADHLVIIPPEDIQNEADARLIAAAPDLLVAMEEYAERWQSWIGDRARTAITKVTASKPEAV
jgi:hypothetical protein